MLFLHKFIFQVDYFNIPTGIQNEANLYNFPYDNMNNIAYNPILLNNNYDNYQFNINQFVSNKI